MRMKARDYQKKALESAWDALQAGKSTMVTLPTGAGKSLVFARLARSWVQFSGGRVLIVAPRRDLVDIAEKTVLQESGYLCGVECGPAKSRPFAPRFSNGELIVVASVQAMVHRLHNFKRDHFSLLVFDEADLACAPSFLRIKRRFSGAKIFGCTATPNRHDGKALSAIFETEAHKETLRDLIERGFLCPIKRCGIKIERSEVDRDHFQAGDFDPKWLDEIFIREKHIHEVVKPMLELAESRPTIVFGTSIRHGELLAEVFNRYRPGCARSVSGVSKDRAETMAAFRRGDFQFLCNCVLLGRGVDIPRVACIGMARPTLSRTLYAQMIGRGTRLYPGKSDLLVIDFTFNSEIHPLTPAAMLTESADVAALAEEFESEKKEGCSDSLALVRIAEAHLEKSAEIRKRIRAKVRFAQYEIDGGYDWKAESRLGQMTDVELGNIIGRSPITVSWARNKLGIPAFRRTPKWNPENDSLLGQMHDTQLSERFGVPVCAIADRRRELGIDKKPKTRLEDRVDWARESRFGKVSDSSIARDLGIDRKLVTMERRRRGIEKFRPTSITEEIIEALGTASDLALAARFGIGKSQVQKWRTERGIARWVAPLKSKCAHGHEFTADNTILDGRKRSCRKCVNRNNVEYRKRIKGAGA